MQKIEEWLDKKLPFVVYQKPNERLRTAWFQTDNQLCISEKLDHSCFVFAPFEGAKKVVFYPENCTIITDDSDFSVDFSTDKNSLFTTNENIKNNHLALVQSTIQAIQSGEYEKVVIARREKVSVEANNYTNYFYRMLKKYPTAFVYWFYHPQVGMWMGATPEQLVKIDQKNIQTVALAGTQIDQGVPLNEVVWGEKEQHEQKIVTDFIIEALRPFVASTDCSRPATSKAGTLLHIKTVINAQLTDEYKAYQAIEALHPTPALCGFPQQKAKDFIIANEGFSREYYGGFLGEWKFNELTTAEKSDLYVNLRCMKLQANEAFLYLGGGINHDSDPLSEFNETVNKSKTIKSIL